MQFLHPSFLWALLALAVPVVIHLFHFRRFKTVYFSNVKFLREIKEETASRSRLKHLLVLAARLLALAFLVFAFAQPFIPSRKAALGTGKKQVSIYIDNSFSMNAVSGGRSLLDKAKQAAAEMVRNFSADDEFQLLTNDFEGRHQRLVGKEELLSMIDDVEISPAVRDLAEITQRQSDALSRGNGQNKIAYLLSDFQKSLGSFRVDTAINYTLIPLAADAQANLYIDTCWFTDPVQLLHTPLTLVVKVDNSGEKDITNSRLVFKLNGQTKTMSELNVAAGSWVYDTLRFTSDQAGWNKAEISVSDYPITYDDNYFAAFNVVNRIKVMAINEGPSNPFLDALFNTQEAFDYTTATAAGLTTDLLKENQLVILNNLNTVPPTLAAALNAYIAEGGAVVVFPGEKCDLESYNRFLNNLRANSITGFSEQPQELAGINLQQNIFKEVFEKVPDNINLPRVMKYYTLSRSATSAEESILLLKDGHAFLSAYPFQNGVLYLFAVPLNKTYSELPVHALFVPLLYKMAVMNMPTGPIAYFIGDKTRVEVDAVKTPGEPVYKVKGEDVEFIPEQFAVGNKILLGLNEQVRKAGFYQVSLDPTGFSKALALNFDRKESDLHFYTASDLKEKYPQQNVSVVNGATAEVATVVKELDRGTALWKWCLFLTLFFLALETALLRFWKV